MEIPSEFFNGVKVLMFQNSCVEFLNLLTNFCEDTELNRAYGTFGKPYALLKFVYRSSMAFWFDQLSFFFYYFNVKEVLSFSDFWFGNRYNFLYNGVFIRWFSLVVRIYCSMCSIFSTIHRNHYFNVRYF